MMLSPILDIEKKPNVQVSVDLLLQKVTEALDAQLSPPAVCQGKKLSFTVRFSDDTEVQELNKEFRGQDKPTNVLSFPAGDDMPGMEKMSTEPMAEAQASIKQDLTSQVTEKYIGDIIVSCDTLEREAREQSKTVDDHLSHLLVHSILHLYGFDHIIDSEAEEMESLEIDILARLGINDPYHK